MSRATYAVVLGSYVDRSLSSESRLEMIRSHHRSHHKSHDGLPDRGQRRAGISTGLFEARKSTANPTVAYQQLKSYQITLKVLAEHVPVLPPLT